jgi:hypothetical protein
MKDPIQPFLDTLPRMIPNADQRRDIVNATKKAMTENDGNKKHVDYLKNADDIDLVMKFIKSKKLSNRQIKNKIREYLNDPEEITDFLKALLKKVDSKKEESKEATGSGSAGGYVAPLFGGEMENESEVPTVREEVLKGGKADNMSLEDISKKHKVPLEDIKRQFQKGMKVEKEHSDNDKSIKEIVMDHLSEDPKYYDKLKKVETKEATTTASSGQYSGPSMWAKTTKKKDWGPSRKAQIPGGKFVQVKKKCKKFPYCNQGDINALRIFENKSVQSVIETVSSKYGVDKNIISDIVFEEIRKTQK